MTTQSKIAPRVPTYEMVQAGAKVVKMNIPYHTGTKVIYEAMIALCPDAPEANGVAVAIVTVGPHEHGPFVFKETPHGADHLADGEHKLYTRPDAPVDEGLRADAFDLRSHLERQREWSCKTFGPGARTQGVLDHIRKELLEIELQPTDLSEWIDVVILALDGAWRAGGQPSEIIAALVAKQAKNESRKWPDWRTADPGKAIEHDRSQDSAIAALAKEK